MFCVLFALGFCFIFGWDMHSSGTVVVLYVDILHVLFVSLSFFFSLSILLVSQCRILLALLSINKGLLSI